MLIFLGVVEGLLFCVVRVGILGGGEGDVGGFSRGI